MADIRPMIAAEIPRLRRYARALTRDVIAADDLVQECLTRALSKSQLWQEGTDLRAWLFTILHNQYVNQVRRSMREGMAVGLDDEQPMLGAPHQEKSLELRDLERALAKLPKEQKSALLLVGMEGMPYEEAAAVLGVAVGTIRSRLSRGREALRQLMGMGTEQLDTDAAARRAPTASRGGDHWPRRRGLARGHARWGGGILGPR